MIPILLVSIYSLQLNQRLKIKERIGTGFFSDVYKGELKPILPFGKVNEVAIKITKGSTENKSKLTVCICVNFS